MRSDHELPDLDDLDLNDQHREVYAWAGLALYMVQVVEHGLVNLLFIARLADPNLPAKFPSADEFFARHFRQVMGQLIKAVRQHVQLPEDIDVRLDEIRRLRNFVVHGFFRERIDLFVEQEGRRLMLAELSAAVRELRHLDRELEDLVFQFGASYGISRERVADRLAELKRAARQPLG